MKKAREYFGSNVVYSICSLVKFLFNSDKGGLHLTDLFSYSSDEYWSLVKVCNRCQGKPPR